MPVRFSFFRPRQRSLVRGIVLSLGALAASLRLAGFPYTDQPHASAWQAVVAPVAFWGMVETARCLSRRRWSLYHAGVLILLYSELMILVLVLFFWAYL